MPRQGLRGASLVLNQYYWGFSDIYMAPAHVVIFMPTPVQSISSFPDHSIVQLTGLRERYLLTSVFAGGAQLSNQLAGMQVSGESASKSRPAANPTQGRRSETPSQNQPTCPSPPAAAAPKTRGSGHEKEAASPASPDEEQPSGAPDPQPPSSGTSNVGPSLARAAVREVWACAGCGKTAEMLESGKLHLCTGCRRVHYCGKACQVADRPVHKSVCKRLQAGAE
jgi:hypothetical protein